MDLYIQSLKKYLAENQPNYGWCDAATLLEMLYYYYTSDNPVDNDRIKKQFQQADQILCQLSLEDNNSIFLLTSDLCEEHAKQAFLSGIQVGMRLFTELAQ